MFCMRTLAKIEFVETAPIPTPSLKIKKPIQSIQRNGHFIYPSISKESIRLRTNYTVVKY